MHSPETGGPEMLIELAYRLIVEETPFIQNIRNNVITLITPVIEVDGREKQVDTYYFNKKRAQGDARLPLMYWGKYVQHDNNRDGMGQFLKLTQAVTKETLEWHPTVIHDLHEAQTYLYSSTGTGPTTTTSIRSSSRVVDARRERRDGDDQARRPGVWTYGFYDGWVPNYMFFIAHSHNSIGRFYEVQSYGPILHRHARRDHDEQGVVPAEPAAAVDQVGAAQQHQHPGVGAAVLAEPRREEQGSLSRELLAEEQARGGQGQDRSRPTLGDSGAQRRKATPRRRSTSCARRGSRSRRPAVAFKAGTIDVKAGDYIVRGDQPFRRWPTCTSRSRTTRRRTRRRTTTPAGRSSTCAISRSCRFRRKASSISR
jgi:Zinc carboxypeptidase.